MCRNRAGRAASYRPLKYWTWLLMMSCVTSPAGAQQLPSTVDELALLRDPQAIQSVVENLTPHQRQMMARHRERFEQLPPAEQERLRSLHRALINDPDAARLFRNMKRYHAWLASLSSAQRAELSDELAGRSPAKRIERIREFQQRQTREWLRQNAYGLKPEDVQAVIAFVRTYVDARRSELLQRVPDRVRQTVSRVDNPGLRNMILWSTANRLGSQPLPTPSPEEVGKLADSLSPAARQQWDRATDETARAALLENWIRAVWQRPDRIPSIPPEALEEFYVTGLTAEQRDQLNQLPPAEMQRRLRRIYLQDRVGDFPPGRGNRRDFNGGPRRGRFDRPGRRRRGIDDPPDGPPRRGPPPPPPE